ncbi:hypothetical protein B5X24_HaOG206181 [Helicoverpa armigera]|nr:hypothetical protein B5X24_HaOG206181 [Helicoverpa armigera]
MRAGQWSGERVRDGGRARSYDATSLYQRPPPPSSPRAARRPLSGICTSGAPGDAVQCTCDRSRPRTNCRVTRIALLITQLKLSLTAWTIVKLLLVTPYLLYAPINHITRELSPDRPSDNSYQCGKVTKCILNSEGRPNLRVFGTLVVSDDLRG